MDSASPAFNPVAQSDVFGHRSNPSGPDAGHSDLLHSSGMTKWKDDPITAEDMADFVGSDSDFAFEMQVLAKLTSLGFTCSHSGTYRDPVTKKIRQFDIRAVKISEKFATFDGCRMQELST